MIIRSVNNNYQNCNESIAHEYFATNCDAIFHPTKFRNFVNYIHQTQRDINVPINLTINSINSINSIVRLSHSCIRHKRAQTIHPTQVAHKESNTFPPDQCNHVTSVFLSTYQEQQYPSVHPARSCITSHGKHSWDKSTAINTITLSGLSPSPTMLIHERIFATRNNLRWPIVSLYRDASNRIVPFLASTLSQLPPFGLFISSWPGSLRQLERPHRGYQKGKSRRSRMQGRGWKATAVGLGNSGRWGMEGGLFESQDVACNFTNIQQHAAIGEHCVLDDTRVLIRVYPREPTCGHVCVWVGVGLRGGSLCLVVEWSMNWHDKGEWSGCCFSNEAKRILDL